MNIARTFLPALLLLASCTGQRESQEDFSDLDPRLGKFLAFTIKDEQTLSKTKAHLNNKSITFEIFIYLTFAEKSQIAPNDHQSMLAQLGFYLENERPPLSRELLTQMERFMQSPENNTMMRGMLVNTVRGIVEGE